MLRRFPEGKEQEPGQSYRLMTFRVSSSGFSLVPQNPSRFYTRITVQFSSQKLPVQTLLALLLSDELSAEDFQVKFVLLSPSERMQLLEQLDEQTSRQGQRPRV